MVLTKVGLVKPEAALANPEPAASDAARTPSAVAPTNPPEHDDSLCAWSDAFRASPCLSFLIGFPEAPAHRIIIKRTFRLFGANGFFRVRRLSCSGGPTP